MGWRGLFSGGLRFGLTAPLICYIYAHMSLEELDLKALAKIIKGLREEKEWNQTDLATKVGVSQPTVHKWERILKDSSFKATRPESPHLEKLAKLAGKSVGEFIRPAVKRSLYDEETVPLSLISVTGYVVPPDGAVHLLDKPTETLSYPTWWTSGIQLAALRCVKGAIGDVFRDWIAYYDVRTRTENDCDDCLGKLCLVMLDEPVIGFLTKPDGFYIEPINHRADNPPTTVSGFDWCAPVLWLHSLTF